MPFTRHNITWDGKLAGVIAARQPGDFTIAKQKTERWYGFANVQYDKLAELIQDNKSLFEVIPSEARCKVYVDYEEYVDKNNVPNAAEELAKHKTQLLNEFRLHFGCNTIIMVSGSIGDVDESKLKVSMHLVFPEIYTENVQERRSLINLMRFVNNNLGLKLGCDLKVYGRNQQFKLVNQAKAKSNRVQAIIEGGDPMQHVVTNMSGTENARKLDLPCFEYNIPQSSIERRLRIPSGSVLNLDTIKPWPLPVEIPECWNIKESPPEDTMDLIKHVDKGEHRLDADPIFCVMSWAKGRRVSFDFFLRWVGQGRELTTQRVERYADEWKRLDPAKRPSDNRIIMMLSLMYPGADMENQTLRRFKWYYDVPVDCRLESLDELEISNKRKRDELERTKVVYLACPMGAGKTQTMLERIRIMDEDTKALFNVSRRTLAMDIHAKCKEKGLYITNYMDHNYHSDRSWREYLDSQHQIVSQDSLFKLRDKSGKIPEYEILIIDEWESYLNQFKSNTHANDGKLEKNWNVFIQLIRNAKTVYVLDAFPSRKGVGFIKDLGYDYKVIATPHTAARRKVSIMPSLKANVYDNIQLRLGYLRYLNRPVLAFFPYVSPHPKRKTIGQIARGAYTSAKDNTDGKFDLEYDKDCLVMEANMDDYRRDKVMEDVNKMWSSKGLVISNSTVTVGVSHTDRHFDRVVIGVNTATNLRDILQFTCRARNLVSNTIEVYFLGGHKSHRQATDLAHNSRLYKRDPVYKKLVDFIDYETQATEEDCFRYLCDKAGYFVDEGCNDEMLGFARKGPVGIDAFFKRLEQPLPFSAMINVVDDTDANVSWGSIYIPAPSAVDENEGLKSWDMKDVDIPLDIFESEEAYVNFLYLRRRIRQRKATTMDKLFWDKCHFQMLFRPNVDDNYIGAIWNKGKVGFVRNLHAYLKATSPISPRWRHPELCKKIENYMLEVCNDAEDAEFPVISDEEAHAIFAENHELTCLSPQAPSGNEMRLGAITKYFFQQSILKNNRKSNHDKWVPNVSLVEDIMYYFKMLEAPQTMQEVERYVFPFMDKPQAATIALEFPFMGHY